MPKWKSLIELTEKQCYMNTYLITQPRYDKFNKPLNLNITYKHFLNHFQKMYRGPCKN